MDLDPILSPNDMCGEAKISLATWRRQFRNCLPVVRLSPKRIGVRRSDWLAALASRTAGQADATPTE
jgi:hypothetical protein